MNEHESYPDPHHDIYSRTVFGFWLYLLTDFVFFGALFASYVVLHQGTYGGPTAKEIFHLPFYIIQKFVMLTSAFTIALAGAAVHRKHKKPALVFLTITFILGIIFMGIECVELGGLLKQGYTWKISAFLSSYFSMITIHGLHVIFALGWTVLFMIPIWKSGITRVDIRRVTCLRMFWQFLSIVWVFIFAFVYLLGALV